MIFAELMDLKKHLENKCKGANVVIGRQDYGVDQYPIVEISSEGTFKTVTMNTIMQQVSIPFQVKIIVANKNEPKAFNLLSSVLESVGTFNPEKGHKLSSDHETKYETNTFSILMNFTLQFKIAGNQ
jgi:hypothetical protein